MVYAILTKLKTANSTKKNYFQRRYQWTGPNYARGVLVVATSAVVGAVGASMFTKYWQTNYDILPPPSHSDDEDRKK
ncbi:hypothetical protein AC249_AIPGENE14573 [Exaiptasia diaphana]|nr:hypothetical protein AC249_AIPGENE14573 [Exaiptasia diaphana]